MKTALIIGCGYVGKALASYWRSKGFYVTGTTRKKENIEPLKKICSNVFFLEDFSDHAFVDVVSHADVIVVSVAPDDRSDYKNTYLKVAKALKNALSLSKNPVHIVYTSSTSVYGDHHGGWVDEMSKTFPQNEQAEILLETEQTFEGIRQEGRQVCIFRLGEIYGPGRSISERLKKAAGASFPGDGMHPANLIHLNDIISAVDFAVERLLNSTYNLCNDIHIPRKKLYSFLCKKENIPDISWDPSKASFHGSAKKVSSEKIKRLGFCFLQNSLETL